MLILNLALEHDFPVWEAKRMAEIVMAALTKKRACSFPCLYTLCTGLKDTNVEGDLVVEHYNKAFKVIFFDIFVISFPPPLLGDLGEPEG